MSQSTPPPQVTAEALAAVGTVIRRTVSDPLSLRHLKEYLAGTDDWNARYLSEESEGHAGAPTPPLFFLAALREVVPASQLDADGQHTSLGTPGITGRSVEGGDDVEIVAPVFLGDTIACEERLVSIDEKVGKSGPLVIVTTQLEYRNQHGARARDADIHGDFPMTGGTSGSVGEFRGNLAVGQSVPGFVITPTPLTIFLFGVAYWTAHRTHYDEPYARSEGYDGVLVPGPLMNAYLVRTVVDWCGDPSLLQRFASRNLAIAVANEELTVGGEVVGLEDNIAVCNLAVTSSGRRIVTATATLCLPTESMAG